MHVEVSRCTCASFACHGLPSFLLQRRISPARRRRFRAVGAQLSFALWLGSLPVIVLLPALEKRNKLLAILAMWGFTACSNPLEFSARHAAFRYEPWKRNFGECGHNLCQPFAALRVWIFRNHLPLIVN